MSLHAVHEGIVGMDQRHVVYVEDGAICELPIRGTTREAGSRVGFTLTSVVNPGWNPKDARSSRRLVAARLRG